MTIADPEPLCDRHAIGEFASGAAFLDEWPKRRARKNQSADASRTFVTCKAGQVVGCYAFASGGVAIAAAPGRFRRNMPEPTPVVVLGRLAVNHSRKGQGLGRALFRDAARRVLHAADPSAFAVFLSMRFPKTPRLSISPSDSNLRRLSP